MPWRLGEVTDQSPWDPEGQGGPVLKTNREAAWGRGEVTQRRCLCWFKVLKTGPRPTYLTHTCSLLFASMDSVAENLPADTLDWSLNMT